MSQGLVSQFSSFLFAAGGSGMQTRKGNFMLSSLFLKHGSRRFWLCIPWKVMPGDTGQALDTERKLIGAERVFVSSRTPLYAA